MPEFHDVDDLSHLAADTRYFDPPEPLPDSAIPTKGLGSINPTHLNSLNLYKKAISHQNILKPHKNKSHQSPLIISIRVKASSHQKSPGGNA